MKERVVLLDNGSLKPEAVFSLRRIAAELSKRLDRSITPVSLLHSGKIDPVELDGERAWTWKRFLKSIQDQSVERVFVLPLFFGPSSAIVDYLPKVWRETMSAEQRCRLIVGRPLVNRDDPSDDEVARILERATRARLADMEASPTVIVVDHGSPIPQVAECRNMVAKQLGARLGDSVSRVVAASMERREGEQYAFNEPLLEGALQGLRPGETELVIALMFFSPGRHAGPGGDIAQIVSESEWGRRGGQVRFTELVGQLPDLIDLLERRYREMRSRARVR
ncbi:hypothetical protein [Pelagicoccus sp. SDUM812003]|uniref:sirohydrochlorin chelatase n=1 Tax=Pelagicoccus sp. SDUM812003 TaxID=3041267 RepID=UPI00280E7FB0|nr:hypothetical protein [Pelagicoccus sp. SDUM812003]MDQ8204904.1 hypothetical protein [Pelagicoccus sp. SDUM812003]